MQSLMNASRHRLRRLSKQPRIGISAAIAGKVYSGITLLLVLVFASRVADTGTYGLISFYINMQLILAALDLGLSTVASREFARARPDTDHAALLRRLEYCYLVPTLIVLVAVLAGSGWASTHLFHLSASHSQSWSVLAMGLALVVELPTKLYLGVLLGRGRQLLNACFLIASDTARWWGGLAVLATTGSAALFMAWQIGTVIVWLLLMAVTVWRGSGLSAFRELSTDRSQFTALFRESVGPLSLSTLAGSARAQVDRFMVASQVSLAALGGYSTATSFSNGLLVLSTQLSGYLMPALTRARGSDGSPWAFARLFDKGIRILGPVAVVGAALLLAAMRPLLNVLHFTPEVSQAFRAAFPMLVLSALAATLAGPPYAALLAEGRFHSVTFINLLCGGALAATLLGLHPNDDYITNAARAVAGSQALAFTSLFGSQWNRFNGTRSLDELARVLAPTLMAFMILISPFFIFAWL